MNEASYYYVIGLVTQFLQKHPYLKEYRADITQEAFEGWLRATKDHKPEKGALNLHQRMGAEYAMRDFHRGLIKSYPPQVVEEDSPYWDLGDSFCIEEIPAPETPNYSELHDILDRISLTTRQREVLDEWLRTGENLETARNLGVDEAYVRRTLAQVIEKAKEVAQC